MPRPTDVTPNRSMPAGCLVVFFAFFLVMGSVFFYMMTLRPLGQIIAASDWVETPCRIQTIQLSEGSGDNGDSHEIEVVYEYEAGGRTYTGDRYSFFMMRSNVTGWMRREVAALSENRQTVCYVNPDDPAESVLRSGFTPSAWWGLFPLPFVLVGLGGIIFALRCRKKQAVPISSTLSATAGRTPVSSHAWLPNFTAPADAANPEPIKLRAASTPGKRALGCLAVTVFWNGIVSIFVVGIIDDALEGRDFPWFPALFISIFVIVGLGMIVGFIYFVMAMFNPRVTLTVARDAVPLGGVLDVAWDFTGPVDRIRRLEIWLEGEERATYRQGTDTRTDTSTFARLPVADTQDATQIIAGAGSITLPLDTMHSLEAHNNKINWSLKVHGHIRRWPDVKEEFPIVVLPIEQALIDQVAAGTGGATA